MIHLESIYLAGPINGCTDDEAHTWREVAKRDYPEYLFVDPMRRDYRGAEDENVENIVHGDLDDIDVADIFLANCWRPSWGTAMEVFYAFNRPMLTYVILPEDARVSPWLRYHSHGIFHSIEEAMTHIKETQ